MENSEEFVEFVVRHLRENASSNLDLGVCEGLEIRSTIRALSPLAAHNAFGGRQNIASFVIDFEKAVGRKVFTSVNLTQRQQRLFLTASRRISAETSRLAQGLPFFGIGLQRNIAGLLGETEKSLRAWQKSPASSRVSSKLPKDNLQKEILASQRNQVLMRRIGELVVRLEIELTKLPAVVKKQKIFPLKGGLFRGERFSGKGATSQSASLSSARLLANLSAALYPANFISESRLSKFRAAYLSVKPLKK